VPIIKNGVQVEGASASEIIFNKVMQHDSCSGMVRITGNVRDFNIGDEIEIGPTPVNRLYIKGEVTGRDDTMSRLIFKVSEMISVPRIPVKKIARRAVRISPSSSIQDAARTMIHNGVSEALVDESSPGLVSLSDLVRAIAEGRTCVDVREIMTRGYLTIDSDDLIYEAIKIMGKTGAAQIVVTEGGVPWGLVNPLDIIRSLTPA